MGQHFPPSNPASVSSLSQVWSPRPNSHAATSLHPRISLLGVPSLTVFLMKIEHRWPANANLQGFFLYGPALTTVHDYWKDIRTFASKVMSLLFNTLSRFVIACLQRKGEGYYIYLCFWPYGIWNLSFSTED